ncbi:MAG: hypothetical protein V2I33_16855 [Kangiellaceae bacterium]|jgi:hypothetical protein|nr:hypothetical protein [Kangiellaceae bacterium]
MSSGVTALLAFFGMVVFVPGTDFRFGSCWAGSVLTRGFLVAFDAQVLARKASRSLDGGDSLTATCSSLLFGGGGGCG